MTDYVLSSEEFDEIEVKNCIIYPPSYCDEMGTGPTGMRLKKLLEEVEIDYRPGISRIIRGGRFYFVPKDVRKWYKVVAFDDEKDDKYVGTDQFLDDNGPERGFQYLAFMTGGKFVKIEEWDPCVGAIIGSLSLYFSEIIQDQILKMRKVGIPEWDSVLEEMQEDILRSRGVK